MNYPKIEKQIRAHFVAQMPYDIEKAKRLATFDLYFGPYAASEPIDSDEIYDGFSVSCDKVKAWCESTLPSDLYFDTDFEEILESKPEGEEIDGEWLEPNWESIYHFTRKEVYRAVLGELASYL